MVRTRSSAVQQAVKIRVDADTEVSGCFTLPSRTRACYVFAPGAGAGIEHPFMQAIAAGLAERDIASLRYQFPYMEKGGKRPDPPAVCHRTVRAAIDDAHRLVKAGRVIAGGKSFGGRMTSQAQAAGALPGTIGLAFLGFPLHLANKPSVERAAHLSDVNVPMLFLQGTRDALADLGLLQPLISRLGAHATLKTIEGADHSFHVPVRSGRTDRDALEELLDAFPQWLTTL
jgi:predicted alpha/beta-hydrolase family hydrolase